LARSLARISILNVTHVLNGIRMAVGGSKFQKPMSIAGPTAQVHAFEIGADNVTNELLRGDL